MQGLKPLAYQFLVQPTHRNELGRGDIGYMW